MLFQCNPSLGLRIVATSFIKTLTPNNCALCSLAVLTRKSLFLQLPWGKSTTKGNALYFHVFDWPAIGRLRLPELKSEIKSAYLMFLESVKLAPIGD